MSTKCSVNISYQSSADFTHPYNALYSWTYSTLIPFSTTTNFLKSSLNSQKISTSFPIIFMITSSSIRAFKYAPLTSAIAVSLCSIPSMIQDKKKASIEQVGDAVSSLVYMNLCFLPSNTDLPFNTGFSGVCPLFVFSSMILIIPAAPFFASADNELASLGKKAS